MADDPAEWDLPTLLGGGSAMSGSRILISAIAVAVVLSLGVASVESAIPNPTNKRFYACFSKKTGAVRLIDYPKVSRCKKGERLRTWNAKGPAGAQGPQGIQGAQGIQGPQGLPGADGITSIRLRLEAQSEIAYGEHGYVTAMCPTGKVVGGGYWQSQANLSIVDSYPKFETAGSYVAWEIHWRKTAADIGTAPQIWAYAMCMTTEPASVLSTVSPAARKAIKAANKAAKAKRNRQR